MRPLSAYLFPQMINLIYCNALLNPVLAQCSKGATHWTAEMAIECTDHSIPVDGGDLPARLYRAPDAPRGAPLVLHLHGGAFVGGSLDCGRAVATLLAEAGAIVISADYPLAPNAPFPKPLVACFRALQSLNGCRAKWATKKSDLYVAGEEAGGNIAASLALMARDQQSPRLAGQILLSPMLDPCLGTTSVRDAAAGPVGCRWADGWHQYLGSAEKACHPYAAPLGATRLGGLAPALIITAEDDPFRDESLNYAERLRKADVQVETQTLSAPTGLPGALGWLGNLNSSWADTLRECFVGFFAHTSSLAKGTTPLTGLRA
jgi:acetyl esterase